MEFQFTPDQEALAREAVAAGRLHHEDEAVQEALALWERRERTRIELLAKLDLAEVSLGRGEGRTITEAAMRELAEEVKARGRTRLAAEAAVLP